MVLLFYSFMCYKSKNMSVGVIVLLDIFLLTKKKAFFGHFFGQKPAFLKEATNDLLLIPELKKKFW